MFLSDFGILNTCGDRNLNALDIILKRIKCKSVVNVELTEGIVFTVSITKLNGEVKVKSVSMC